MNTREAVAARILELCKERGITPNGLSSNSPPAKKALNRKIQSLF